MYIKVFQVLHQPEWYGLPNYVKHSLLVFRPILSSVRTYNYQLVKCLCKLLDDVIPNDYYAKDTFSFVEDLKTVSVTNKCMVSYNVTGLFTNLSFTIDFLSEAKLDFKIGRKDLEKYFPFATNQSIFLLFYWISQKRVDYRLQLGRVTLL